MGVLVTNLKTVRAVYWVNDDFITQRMQPSIKKRKHEQYNVSESSGAGSTRLCQIKDS